MLSVVTVCYCSLCGPRRIQLRLSVVPVTTSSDLVEANSSGWLLNSTARAQEAGGGSHLPLNLNSHEAGQAFAAS